MYQASEKRYDSMNYFLCGNSGLKLPAVAFGIILVTTQIMRT